jgi:hypothetical protein
VLRWVVLLGLVACVEPAPELPWRLELAVPEREGTIFDLYVVEGTCMTRPSAPARSWKRGDAPFELRLSNGPHAIRATAVDPSCRVYASGCVELTVPRDSATEGPIVLRLGAAPEIERCGNDRCEAGLCVTPTSDGGSDTEDGGVDAPFDAGAEPDGCTATTWYLDGDDDGFGDDTRAVISCEPPPAHVALGGDCDDDDERANPEGTEACTATDLDCDGIVDEGGVCPGCFPFVLDEVGYLGCPAEVGWAQARATCLEGGRDLVTIETAEEDDALRRFVLARFGVQQFWIGLQDVDGDGVFRWARSGEEPTFLPWTDMSPDDPPPACVRSTGASTPPGWRDRACNDPFMFVCDDR